MESACSQNAASYRVNLGKSLNLSVLPPCRLLGSGDKPRTSWGWVVVGIKQSLQVKCLEERLTDGRHSASITIITNWLLLFSQTGHGRDHCFSLRAKEPTGRDQNKRQAHGPSHFHPICCESIFPPFHSAQCPSPFHPDCLPPPSELGIKGKGRERRRE